jgi:hypothetical protein
MRRRSFLALAASLALVPLREATLAAQTPAAVDGDTALMAMLRLLPGDPPGQLGVRYANFAVQRAALGIAETGVDIDPETWVAAMRAPMMAPGSMADPMDPMWREGLGFDLRDVDQMAEVGASDTSILILTGQFDAPTLTAAWEAGGYTPVETGGVTWHTLGADNVLFNPDVPLSDWHLGMLSHLAVLDGATIVGTAKRVDMERVLALRAGEGGSFADGLGAPLAAAPNDLAVGWIVDGAELVMVTDPLATMSNNPNVPADVQERMATQAAEMVEEAPRMPPITLALVGAMAGTFDADAAASFPDAPRGHAVAVVVPATAADAEMVAETATRRLTTLSAPVGDDPVGRPYTEIFPEMAIETLPAGAVVADLTPASDVPSSLLIRLLQARQMSFLYWGP